MVFRAAGRAAAKCAAPSITREIVLMSDEQDRGDRVAADRRERPTSPLDALRRPGRRKAPAAPSSARATITSTGSARSRSR